MFAVCEHKAYPCQFRISSKRSLNLINDTIAFTVNLRKLYQYSYIYLNLAQIHFPTLSLLKTFLDTTQSKVSISINFYYYLNLAQIHFTTLRLLKTFLDTTQSKVSISIQLFKHW